MDGLLAEGRRSGLQGRAMRRVWSAVVAGLMVQMGAAAHAAPKVVNPDWLERPDGDKIAAAFPKLASMLGVEGRAVIACKVDARGALNHCEVVTENPPELGFGAAAVALSKSFKMSPKMVDGRATDDGDVRIPIGFKLPEKPQSEPTTKSADVFKAPSTHALEMAQRIVAAQGLSSAARVQFEVSIINLVDAKWPGVDDKVRDDGIEALRSGFDSFLLVFETSLARSYATSFSEAELTDIEAFVTSPSGRAFTAGGARVMAEAQATAARSQEIVTQAARQKFCAEHPCSAAPPPAP